MRAPGILVLAALLLLPIGPVADGGASVSGPALSPGDTWTYRTNTSLTSGLSLDGRVTLTVTSHQSSVVEGRTYDAYTMSLTGTGTASGTFARFGSTPASGSWVLTGQQIVDARGLNILSTVVDLEANGTLHTQPIPLSFTFSVQNTTSYRLQDDTWPFPHSVGDTANVSSQMNFTEDFRLFYGFPTTPVHSAGILWWNVTYAFDAAVGIDPPAGHFDTYPIRATYADGTYTRFFYAPVAGNHARTEAHNGTTPVASADLVSYRYQALEPPRFLGLTMIDWTIVAVAAATTCFVFVLWWRRKRSAQPPASPPLTL